MLDIAIYTQVEDILVNDADQYIVFMTEEYVPVLAQLQEKFKGAQMYGAIVPHLILGKELVPTVISVLRFQREHSFALLHDMTKDVAPIIEKIAANRPSSLLLFTDGLSASFEPFISNLNKVLDQDLTVMGSGVGYKDMQQHPVIFNNSEIFEDVALVIGTDLHLTAGVKHGWKSLYGPLIVTKAEHNIVYELNGERAFGVYQRALKERENVEITKEYFFDVAKSYPLGISSFSGDEFIMRAPVAAQDDDSLVIVSSVNEFDSLYIMKGVDEALIRSSRELSTEVFSRTNSPVALMIDCISRVLFLQERYNEELQAVFMGSGYDELNLYGIISTGEISNHGYNEIKIFNNTTLLGSINEQ